jgi:hypothetical protein
MRLTWTFLLTVTIDLVAEKAIDVPGGNHKKMGLASILPR